MKVLHSSSEVKELLEEKRRVEELPFTVENAMRNAQLLAELAALGRQDIITEKEKKKKESC